MATDYIKLFKKDIRGKYNLKIKKGLPYSTVEQREELIKRIRAFVMLKKHNDSEGAIPEIDVLDLFQYLDGLV